MQRLIDRENKTVLCRHREKSERLTDRENERVTRQRFTDREKSDKETEKIREFHIETHRQRK